MFTVEGLRKNGYRVRVTHKRVDIVEGLLVPMHEFRQGVKDGYFEQDDLSPKGGETVVEVTTPNNELLVGVAKCSALDAYNKKLGVSIALGRAMKHPPTKLEPTDTLKILYDEVLDGE